MEEKPNYYAIIPANVRYDNTLKANEKLLYGEITSLCSKDGICWASNEYFAKLYSTTKETVSRWISNLVDKQYIKIKMFYKTNSKQIDKRIITINSNIQPIDEIVNTYCQKNQDPIDENVKENNTSNNNIYSPSDDEQDSSSSNDIAEIFRILSRQGREQESSSSKEKELSEHFDMIWDLYPRKDGKNTAFNHYKAWLNGKKYAGRTVKLTERQMWFAVRIYEYQLSKENKERQYIKMGSTFFNEAIYEFVEIYKSDIAYWEKLLDGGKKDDNS